MGFLFLMGLIYLIASDSWTMRTLLHWPLDRYTWNRPWLCGFLGFLGFLRALAPLRLINGYGVFPPGALPPMLEMPVFEGSDDGVTWRAYRYRHAPSSAGERPRFVAPYHPRIDMASGYSSTCVSTPVSTARWPATARPTRPTRARRGLSACVSGCWRATLRS